MYNVQILKRVHLMIVRVKFQGSGLTHQLTLVICVNFHVKLVKILN